MRVPKFLADLKAQRDLLDRAIGALEAVIDSRNQDVARASDHAAPAPGRFRSNANPAQTRPRTRRVCKARARRKLTTAKVIPFYIPSGYVRERIG